MTNTSISFPAHGLRALLAALSTCVLVSIAALLPTQPAQADDAITSQDYFSYYHLDSARQKGYTGKGIKIAMIDGAVDTSAPELAGANIIDKSPCRTDSTPQAETRATAVASVLVSRAYGVAPDATLMTYQALLSHEVMGSDCVDEDGRMMYDIPALIHQAINDGAQIITLSFTKMVAQQEDKDAERNFNDTAWTSILKDDNYKWAFAHAIDKGVIVVASMGSEAKDQSQTSFAAFSGVVGVSSITVEGKFAEFSSTGSGVVTTAVGSGINIRDYVTRSVVKADGTAFATGIAAGGIALAIEKWPNATANQMLQSLVRNGLNPDHKWNKFTGFGAANLGGMIHDDPSKYPDENPLADKTRLGDSNGDGNGGSFTFSASGSVPTVSQVAWYRDGLESPLGMKDNPQYVYRGLDDLYMKNESTSHAVHLGTSPRFHKKKN